MLHDKAKIYVIGGRGGDGSVSFRREAHVPKGGPDGGNGGRGGDIVLMADPSIKDLASLRHSGRFEAQSGGKGSGSQRHGADGEDRVIPVAVGTVVRDIERDRVHDLFRPKQTVVVASGGVGGKGNKRFAGPTRQTPRFSERGEEGETTSLSLQLKLLADVALVGKPNAGKSLLVSKLTRAQPKVADYPFTTTEPVLGTAEKDGRQLVVADIPGLIEGAATGVGLGHEFLAHIERTRLIVHIVEVLPVDESDPSLNLKAVDDEIRSYDPNLVDLPKIVALSKCDLMDDEKVSRISDNLASKYGSDVEIYPISSVTGAGLEELLGALFRLVPEEDVGPADEKVSEPARYKLYTPAKEHEVVVKSESEGSFRISGKRAESLINRLDLENQEALDYLEQRLKKMGVVEMLERSGFKSGDEICIGDAAFEFWV